MQANNLQQAILQTLSDATEFSAELIDTALQVGTDSEVLERVPIVSWGVKMLQIRDIFQRNRFVKNCSAFVEALKKDEEIEARLKVFFEKNSLETNDVLDTTQMILVESEKPLKVEMFARLLRNRVSGQIGAEEFRKIALMIYAASIPALESIPAFFNRNGGLFNQNNGSVPEEPLLLSLGVAARYGSNFRVDEIGQKIFDICFRGDSTSQS